MNSDTVKVVLGFLTSKEANSLSQTAKFFSCEVKKHRCIVVAERICWGVVEPGMTWEKQEQTGGQQPVFTRFACSTKQNALTLMEGLKKDTKTFAVKVGYKRDFVGCDYDENRNSTKWFSRWDV